MASKPAPPFEMLRAEYAQLWRTMRYDPGREAGFRNTAQRILNNRARYELVSAHTGAPWYVIGIIHNMESSLNFSRHLHNGDPLTARTFQVPAGRPVHKPANGKSYSWEESAIDALRMKRVDQIRLWSVERIAYVLEGYNGWGYRHWHADDLSPYLWSGTSHNDGRGKYVADGRWDANAPSEGQSGGMALLKMLDEMVSLNLVVETADTAPPRPSQMPAQPPAQPAPVGRKATTPAHLSKDEVKRLQLRLRELGYPEVGDIDGLWGKRSAGAFTTWKQDNDIKPLDESISPEIWKQLENSLPRGVAPERAGATKTDLIEKGSPVVTLADRFQKASGAIGALGVGGAAVQQTGILAQAQDLSSNLTAWQSVAMTFGMVFRWVSGFFAEFWWLILLAVGIFGFWQAQRIISAKLREYRKGEAPK